MAEFIGDPGWEDALVANARRPGNHKAEWPVVQQGQWWLCRLHCCDLPRSADLGRALDRGVPRPRLAFVHLTLKRAARKHFSRNPHFV